MDEFCDGDRHYEIRYAHIRNPQLTPVLPGLEKGSFASGEYSPERRHPTCDDSERNRVLTWRAVTVVVAGRVHELGHPPGPSGLVAPVLGAEPVGSSAVPDGTPSERAPGQRHRPVAGPIMGTFLPVMQSVGTHRPSTRAMRWPCVRGVRQRRQGPPVVRAFFPRLASLGIVVSPVGCGRARSWLR